MDGWRDVEVDGLGYMKGNRDVRYSTYRGGEELYNIVTVYVRVLEQNRKGYGEWC